MKRDQRGFSIAEGLIVLVVVVAVGAVGWYLYTQRNKPPQSQPTTQQTPTPITDVEEKPVAATDSWYEYNIPGYSVRLADGLVMKESSGTIFTHDVTYKPGTKATVEQQLGGGDNPYILFFQFSAPGHGSRIRGDKTTYTNPQGVHIDKYTFTQTADPEGIDIAKGDKEVSYLATKNDKTAWVYYSSKASEANPELVDKMVNTLDIQ